MAEVVETVEIEAAVEATAAKAVEESSTKEAADELVVDELAAAAMRPSALSCAIIFLCILVMPCQSVRRFGSPTLGSCLSGRRTFCT